MNPNHVRLINAARKALFQRTKLSRSAETARAQFAPPALKARAKRNAMEKVEIALGASEAALRKYSLPIGLAALAGLAFAFRRPLGQAAQSVADQIDKLTTPSPLPTPEHDDEPV